MVRHTGVSTQDCGAGLPGAGRPDGWGLFGGSLVVESVERALPLTRSRFMSGLLLCVCGPERIGMVEPFNHRIKKIAAGNTALNPAHLSEQPCRLGCCITTLGCTTVRRGVEPLCNKPHRCATNLGSLHCFICAKRSPICISLHSRSSSKKY